MSIMPNKQKFDQRRDDTEKGSPSKRSKQSWKTVTTGIKYFQQGRYEKALPLLLKYEDVEAKAMYVLALMYWNGLGINEDMKMAVSYMQKLIGFQNTRPEDMHLVAMALFYIGDLYYRGLVLAKNDMEAERHWRLGACMITDAETEVQYLGTTKCQSALGMFYSTPSVIKPDKAFYWHQKASKSGSVISEAALGVMYMYGIGAEENTDLAYHHLTNAAVLGNVYAKGYLAAFCYNRQLYHRTVSLGKELADYQDYELLARRNDCHIEHIKHGVAVGSIYLALCLQDGNGVEKNIHDSKTLIKKAIEISPNIACDLHEKLILGSGAA